MTNEERIERLRKCASFETCNPEMCDLWSKDDCRSILLKDAADALEAAEKRIAETEKQDSVEMHKKQVARIAELEAQAEALKEESEAYKFGYLDGKTESDRKIEDLQAALTACRLRKDESQLQKEGEWIEDEYGYIHCSRCGMEGYPKTKFCPNCGARMRTVTDCHTLEEGER